VTTATNALCRGGNGANQGCRRPDGTNHGKPETIAQNGSIREIGVFRQIDLNFLPPPDNHKFIRGRFILSQRAREFYADFDELWNKLKSRPPKMGGWVVVEFDIRFPNRVRRDAGNYIKMTMDALVKAGAIDDDQFALPRIRSIKRYPDDDVQEGITISWRPATADERPGGNT